MANPTTTTTKSDPRQQAVVKPTATPEVAKAEGIVSRPLFTTTVEDAPVSAPRQLNPKTIAEQAAGKEAIKQYS